MIQNCTKWKEQIIGGLDSLLNLKIQKEWNPFCCDTTEELMKSSSHPQIIRKSMRALKVIIGVIVDFYTRVSDWVKHGAALRFQRRLPGRNCFRKRAPSTDRARSNPSGAKNALGPFD
jgi:hypothetical protein